MDEYRGGNRNPLIFGGRSCRIKTFSLRSFHVAARGHANSAPTCLLTESANTGRALRRLGLGIVKLFLIFCFEIIFELILFFTSLQTRLPVAWTSLPVYYRACLFYGRYGPRCASAICPSLSSANRSFHQLFLRVCTYVRTLLRAAPAPPAIFPHGPRTRLHAPLERGRNALPALRLPSSFRALPCLSARSTVTPLSHCAEEF